MKRVPSEGLRIARLMMVLSSLSPLFLLWAIRGVSIIPNDLFWSICLGFIIIPNLILYWRTYAAKKYGDEKIITIGQADDHREHLIVYLFAMLVPLYDANLGSVRDFLATVVAFIFVVFLFWHLNMHYMNIFYAIFGYRVYTIQPPLVDDGISGCEPFVLLTKRTMLKPMQQINALRISNTVFLERGDSYEKKF